MVNGHQFAITENKKVIFTGYLWSNYSSYQSHWNSLYFNPPENCKEEQIELDLYRNNGLKEVRFDSINFKNYPELISAFSLNNKIK